jgi:hypothetical protein
MSVTSNVCSALRVDDNYAYTVSKYMCEETWFISSRGRRFFTFSGKGVTLTTHLSPTNSKNEYSRTSIPHIFMAYKGTTLLLLLPVTWKTVESHSNLLSP